ncbi:MAG: 4-hydroxy-tetrahydrodipicolinate synthase [Balneolaceae bacterium]
MNFRQVKLWTALITPMDDSGEVDYESLETIVRKQEAAGNGILLLGSTGEGLALTIGEKSAVVQSVMKMNPSSPVMVGVGGFNLKSQQEWIGYCNRLDVDAFLLVAPLYSKPGPRGMEKWFRLLMDTSDKPCMLYNIPGRTGVRIPPDIVGHLNGHPNMWSLKEASGSVDEYRAFRERVPRLPVYSGDDALLPLFASEGCSGLVSVAANVWPEATGRYVELALGGKLSGGMELWKKGAETLFSVSNPIPSKILLMEKGWIKSPVLRLPLTHDELTDKSPLLKADKEILNWYLNEKN